VGRDLTGADQQQPAAGRSPATASTAAAATDRLVAATPVHGAHGGRR
jgi:hypothetical protein